MDRPIAPPVTASSECKRQRAACQDGRDRKLEGERHTAQKREKRIPHETDIRHNALLTPWVVRASILLNTIEENQVTMR